MPSVKQSKINSAPLYVFCMRETFWSNFADVESLWTAGCNKARDWTGQLFCSPYMFSLLSFVLQSCHLHYSRVSAVPAVWEMPAPRSPQWCHQTKEMGFLLPTTTKAPPTAPLTGLFLRTPHTCLLQPARLYHLPESIRDYSHLAPRDPPSLLVTEGPANCPAHPYPPTSTMSQTPRTREWHHIHSLQRRL